MTTEIKLTLRHHDMIDGADMNKFLAAVTSFKIQTRLLTEVEIYEEGVLPPMITLFCKFEELKNVYADGDFINTLTQFIDTVRTKNEPGFYSGPEFKPAPSLAIFALLENGTTLKLYIKDVEGSICNKAINHIPAFIGKYNFNQLVAKTSLGLIAFFDAAANAWTPVGF